MPRKQRDDAVQVLNILKFRNALHGFQVVPLTCPPPVLETLANGHVQTLLPHLFRRPGGVSYQRERIDTPDDDFLDLDWARIGAASRIQVHTSSE